MISFVISPSQDSEFFSCEELEFLEDPFSNTIWGDLSIQKDGQKVEISRTFSYLSFLYGLNKFLESDISKWEYYHVDDLDNPILSFRRQTVGISIDFWDKKDLFFGINETDLRTCVTACYDEILAVMKSRFDYDKIGTAIEQYKLSVESYFDNKYGK